MPVIQLLSMFESTSQLFQSNERYSFICFIIIQLKSKNLKSLIKHRTYGKNLQGFVFSFLASDVYVLKKAQFYE